MKSLWIFAEVSNEWVKYKVAKKNNKIRYTVTVIPEYLLIHLSIEYIKWLVQNFSLFNIHFHTNNQVRAVFDLTPLPLKRFRIFHHF